MGPDELSEYCRQVEDHLTRVNGGHLVRVVGAGFELVRGWAEAGVPLSVVFRGIDLKADRHRFGHARRPLRIEFCEHDVRDVFEAWRRAVGVAAAATPAAEDAAGATAPRRPSLARHLDRAIDRLAQAAGRTDLPAPLLDAVSEILRELASMRDRARGARGAIRDELSARLPALDADLLAAARASTEPVRLLAFREEATRELAAFRGRLDADAWERAVAVTVDRLVRDRYGLPQLEF